MDYNTGIRFQKIDCTEEREKIDQLCEKFGVELDRYHYCSTFNDFVFNQHSSGADFSIYIHFTICEGYYGREKFCYQKYSHTCVSFESFKIISEEDFNKMNKFLKEFIDIFKNKLFISYGFMEPVMSFNTVDDIIEHIRNYKDSIVTTRFR